MCVQYENVLPVTLFFKHPVGLCMGDLLLADSRNSRRPQSENTDQNLSSDLIGSFCRTARWFRHRCAWLWRSAPVFCSCCIYLLWNVVFVLLSLYVIPVLFSCLQMAWQQPGGYPQGYFFKNIFLNIVLTITSLLISTCFSHSGVHTPTPSLTQKCTLPPPPTTNSSDITPRLVSSFQAQVIYFGTTLLGWGGEKFSNTFIQLYGWLAQWSPEVQRGRRFKSSEKI